MNSYELSRIFFDWAYENPDLVKPNHIALYFFAIEHCNRLGWKQKFGLPSGMAKEAIGIRSYNTYINTLKDLIKFGFIELIEESKNQYSSTIITITKPTKKAKSAISKNDKALDKAFIKHDTKQIVKQSESTVQSIDSINKPLTSKPLTNNHKLTFSEIKQYFIGVEYDNQDSDFKNKYSKFEYDSYCDFIEFFLEYESQIEKNDFPKIKFFKERIQSKFKKEEIISGVEKMFGLGVNQNAIIGLRIIECIGFVTKNNNHVNKATDVNAMNELSSYKNMKDQMGGEQSFKKKKVNE